ncbi:MAG: hypothetical protein WA705_24860 [Candidatus Ozemobacteraceae bacterium]
MSVISRFSFSRFYRCLPVVVLFLGFCFACCSMSSAAEELLQTEPPAAVKEIIPIVDDFFGKLQGKNATDSLKLLFAIFPIEERSQKNFRSDIQLLTDRLGFPSGHEFVGFRSIGKSDRFFLVYFMTHHDKMPVAWEFTFYRPTAEGKWQINYLRYNSDEVFEFLAYPKLRFEGSLRATEQPAPPRKD